MLKFWKGAGKGKAPSRPPDTPSPSGSTGDSGINSLSTKFDFENIRADCQDEKFPARESSRLSKNLLDTLSDRQSLAYFVDFMESSSASLLIDFWLDAQRFREAAVSLDSKTCINSNEAHHPINRTVSFDSSFLEKNKPRLSNGSNLPSCLVNESDAKSYSSLCKNIGEIAGSAAKVTRKDSVLNQAVSIFKKYVALESPQKLDFPDDVRNTIVSSICHPDGVIDPDIFKIAQDHILEQMSALHFDKYAQSDHHCKYQLDILTSGGLTIEDIVYNQTALFYFMEYLEQEQCNLLLEFVMAVMNFKEQMIVNADIDPEQAQNDAIVLYEKYFSLQATHSLGFSSEIRLHIEERICQEGGPSPDCFHKPFRLVLIALKQHINGFLTSQTYYRYLTELVGSMQGSWQHKKSSASDCSSSDRNTAVSKNTNGESSSSSMRIDLKQLYNGDLLWRRKSDKGLCLGRVNSLGRFESSMEPDPEKRVDSSILKRVVSKIVRERDKAEEELAWQVAHMIVKDVTDVTMGIPEGQL